VLVSRVGSGAIDGQAQTPRVDTFLNAIGGGISGLVQGSFSTIGSVLRGMVDTLNRALPGGMLAAVVFVVLVVAAWQLARR